MNQKWKKRLLLTAITAFVLSLIPICVLSFYNNPANDDFYYSLKTHQAIQESGSFPAAVRAAAEQVKESYFNWQGTFSAIFLFALQPAVFGREYYALSTFLILGAWIASSLFLMRVLLCSYCHASRRKFWAISLTFLFLSIQFLPSPAQGFFWWNGSVYYVFFCSLAQVLLGLLLWYLQGQRSLQNVVCMTASLPLAVLVSGGNYVTALLTLLILAGLTVCTWIRQRKKAVPVTFTLCVFLAGFLVSMCAPGNAERVLSYPDSPSAPAAVLQALYYGASFLCDWPDVPMICILLLLCPFFYRISSHAPLKFRHPLLVLAGSFCLYAAQFAPPCYGMGAYGEGRILNVIYFGYLWFLFLNTFYLCGALRVRFGARNQAFCSQIRPPVRIVCFLFFTAVCTSFFRMPAAAVEEEAARSFTSLSALYSLCSGEARQYAEENAQRFALLEDPTVTDVKASPFTVHPWCLYYSDWTQDPNYEWSNLPLARYYGKNTVVVVWE